MKTRHENLLVVLFATTFGLLFFDRIGIAFLLPRITPELRLNGSQIGMLSGALGLCWAASSLVVPALAEKYNCHKRLLVGLVFTFSVFTLLCGLAGSFTSLLMLRALVGLAQGPVLPIVQSMMAQASTPARRGFNMGVLQNAGGAILGNLLAPLVMAGLAACYGWRSSMMLVGLPGFALALMLALVLREPQIPRLNSASGSAHAFRTLLARRNVVFAILIGSLQLGTLVVVTSFTPLQLIQERGWSEAEMSGFMATLGAAGLFWGIYIPWAADRWGRRSTLQMASLFGALLPLSIAYLPGGITPLLAAGFVSFLTGPAIVIAVAVVTMESVPIEKVTTVAGVVMGLVEFVGGFLAPVIAGFAHDAFGPSAPFVFAATMSVAAGLLAPFLVETRGPSTRM